MSPGTYMTVSLVMVVFVLLLGINVLVNCAFVYLGMGPRHFLRRVYIKKRYAFVICMALVLGMVR